MCPQGNIKCEIDGCCVGFCDDDENGQDCCDDEEDEEEDDDEYEDEEEYYNENEEMQYVDDHTAANQCHNANGGANGDSN